MKKALLIIVLSLLSFAAKRSAAAKPVLRHGEGLHGIEFHLEGLAAENMAIPPARSEAQTFVLQDSNSLSSNPVVI